MTERKAETEKERDRERERQKERERQRVLKLKQCNHRDQKERLTKRLEKMQNQKWQADEIISNNMYNT